MEKLVTIVIPSYNHSRYVESTIYSALNQTYQSIEVIVIDDGSTDDSVRKISDIRSNRDFIFLHRENLGRIKTLNQGLKMASGDYIIFLASDDCLLSDHVEKSVSALSNVDKLVAGVYCDGFIFNSDSVVTDQFSRKYPRPIVGGIKNNLLVGNWLPAVGVTYRTHVLSQFPFKEKFLIEDYALYLDLVVNQGFRFEFYSSLSFCYRVHAKNISASQDIMARSHFVISESFPDLKQFNELKNSIKSFKLLKALFLLPRNYKPLFLNILRICQATLLRFDLKSRFQFRQGG